MIRKENDELKRIREALEQSENKYSELFELSPVGWSLCDSPGRFIRGNPPLPKMPGDEESEILKLSNEYIKDSAWLSLDENIGKALEDIGKYGLNEKIYIHKNGESVYVRMNNIKVQGDGITCIWSSIEDISGLKLVEMDNSNPRLNIYTLHLTRPGYKLKTCTEGKAGLDIFQKIQVHLILSLQTYPCRYDRL